MVDTIYRNAAAGMRGSFQIYKISYLHIRTVEVGIHNAGWTGNLVSTIEQKLAI